MHKVITGNSVAATVEHIQETAKKYKPSGSGGCGDSTNATFGFTTDSGIEHYTYPCHRHLNKVPASGTKAVWSLYCKPQVSQLTEEMHRRHFAWLVDAKISPWRSLLNQEPHSEFSNEEFWWSNGFVFSNFLNMPANLIMNFFVATRMPKEWPYTIQTWDALVRKYNVDPALAYTAIKLFNGDLLDPETSFTFNTSDFYDWPLNNGTCSEEYVRNFCLGLPVSANGTLGLKNEAGAEEPYGKINSVWGDSNCAFKGKKHSYQRVLFEMYSGEMGKGSAKKRTFTEEGDYSYNWALTFEEVIKLLHLEEERMLNATSTKKSA